MAFIGITSIMEIGVIGSAFNSEIRNTSTGPNWGRFNFVICKLNKKGGKMKKLLEEVINESRIWEGSRRNSHSFLLSPSVYKISKVQEEELARLGYALSDCLLGLSHIAVIAYDSDLNYGGAWTAFRRVFSTGVLKVYQELQGMNIKDVPKLLKVDLMVDEQGNFKIAEIDGHNKHGLGYSTLGMRFRQALYPGSLSLPGAVHKVAAEVRRLGHAEIKLFYADQERFYIPEFEIASQEFARQGIRCDVISEMDIQEKDLKKGLFLDLPFLFKRSHLYETIISSYKAGDVQFIIPPKPFLGAKGVLALLRNDGKDEQLEAILRTFIKKSSLDLARQYIPETFLVGKHAVSKETVLEKVSQQRYVLKESISSGMKGTIFSDDPDFDDVLIRASASNANWILQQEVTNQPQEFSWYEGKAGSECQTSTDWFMRVTVQYVNRSLSDIIVTARRDKSVHGAEDCIQLGTIIK